MFKYVLNKTRQNKQIKSERRDLKSFLKANAIEEHPAWNAEMNLQAIANFLADQTSFTYVLSQDQLNSYVLSYLRGSDRKVIHIHFGVIFDLKFNRYAYRNHTHINFSSVEALIRYKMKGRGIPSTTFLLECTA